MLKEFKAFIDRGNLVQLAVAFIMGVTFAAIVTSLVNDIIMPAVGLALGGLDFTSLFAVIKDGDPIGPYNTVAAAKEAGAVTINYGIFINTIIVFIIVALVLFLDRQGLHEDPEARGRGSHHQGMPVLLHEHPESCHPLPELHLGAARFQSLTAFPEAACQARAAAGGRSRGHIYRLLGGGADRRPASRLYSLHHGRT